LNHNLTAPLPAQTTDEIFRSEGLPYNLLVLNERDRMAISFGFEQHGILLAEAEIVKRRHRQQLVVHRMNELEMETKEVEIQEHIRQMERTLDMGVIEALQSVLVACPPNPVAHERHIPINMSGKLLSF
jgi:hypothetical protein